MSETPAVQLGTTITRNPSLAGFKPGALLDPYAKQLEIGTIPLVSSKDDGSYSHIQYQTPKGKTVGSIHSFAKDAPDRPYDSSITIGKKTCYDKDGDHVIDFCNK